MAMLPSWEGDGEAMEDIDHETEHGHFFTKKTFHKPTYCHHCTEIMWGIIGTGFVCEVCNFVVHEKCLRTVVSPCSSVATNFVKNPVPHCWSEVGHFKRKFCNLCRKRLEDSPAIRCQICEYYFHIECQDFVVSDCKDCATYTPKNAKNKVKQVHHWREGNLPGNAKCLLCKKTCWSSECLAGMRCEWCGVTAHATCYRQLPIECSFGVLRGILLPPNSITTPRIDLPIETILGIGQRQPPPVRTVSGEEFSSSGESKADDDERRSTSRGVEKPADLNREDADGVGGRTRGDLLGATSGSAADGNGSGYDNGAGGSSNSSSTAIMPSNSSAAAPTESTLPSASIGNSSGNSNGSRSTSNAAGGSTTNNIAATNASSSHHHSGTNTRVLPSSSTPMAANSTLPAQPSLTAASALYSTALVPSSSNASYSTVPSVAHTSSKHRHFEIVRIFDGNSSQRKKLYRTVAVPKTADVSVLLDAALRTFHISDNPSNYCLSEVNDSDETEQILDSSQAIRYQLTNRDGKRPSIFLRYRDKDPDRGYIRVYPGNLGDQISLHFKNIPVTGDSTASDVLERAMKKFGCEDDVRKFVLVEMLLDKGVRERELAPDEKPWLLVQTLRRESLRQYKMTRFYIKEREDPHGPQISLYVGNLPTSLSQKQYEKILRKIVGSEHRWSGVDVIYYEYGALVLLFNCARTACAVYDILAEANAVFDEKQLLVLLLPNIQPQNIPSYVTPLLVLVNVKSGGQQGQELIKAYRKCVNPHQVFDLMQGGPLPGLYVFRNIPHFKIMVCGGDGTVGWALSCLDNVGQDALCASPPMAIIPLGTGNDLARVLRWGQGYSGSEEPLSLLRDTIDAEEIKLDRWTVIFHPNEKEGDDPRSRPLPDETSNLEDQTSIFVMNNYFGIGIDADLSLDFHMAREDKPDKFNSRMHNKGVYFKMGLRKMVRSHPCKDLQKLIRVELDGKTVEIPQVEGIIILNILSWGSGANPWGSEKEEPKFTKPTHYDGNLEIVGITGVMHMGRIQGGFCGGIRIAQGGHLRIHLLTELPVHVDGEPWVQPAGQVVVLRSALKATMLKKSKSSKMKRRNTEPSIFFPNDPHLSTQAVPQADGESGPA